MSGTKRLVESPTSSSSWEWMTSSPTVAVQYPDEHDRQLVVISSNKTTKKASSSSNVKPQQQQHFINWKLSNREVIQVHRVNIQHYTSLRDIIPAAMFKQQQEQQQQDPWFLSSEAHFHKGSGGHSPRTRMKNHLVEQAARAYLQPTTIDNSSNHFFPWNWQKLMGSTPLTFTFSTGTLPKRDLFSRVLRYLLGRVRPQPMGFLQHPRLCL